MIVLRRRRHLGRRRALRIASARRFLDDLESVLSLSDPERDFDGLEQRQFSATKSGLLFQIAFQRKITFHFRILKF